MTKLIFPILVFCFHFVYSQSGQAIYQIDLDPDGFLSSRSSEYLLEFDSRTSHFSSLAVDLTHKVNTNAQNYEVRLRKDSLLFIVENGGSRSSYVYDDYHTTDLDNNDVYFNHMIGTDVVNIKKNQPPLKWQLLTSFEKVKIAGLDVQKAMVTHMGREYIAYYAPSINTTAAPYKFRGLPGLLVSLRSRDGYVSIELVNYKGNDNNLKSVELKPNAISFEEYKIKLREFKKMRYEALTSGKGDGDTTFTVKFVNFIEIPDIEPLVITY